MQTKAYASEFLGTGLMLGFGLLAVAMFWSASSPLADLAINPGLRRLMTGFCFAGGATLLIYSPLGQISGGHLNPSVTLAFLALKKISLRDSFGYILAQFAGAVTGVGLLFGVLFGLLGWSDGVAAGATRPGSGYALPLVFLAEIVITFLLMFSILLVSNKRSIAKFTPAVAGTLVMLMVWIESPISGTSLNAARSFAPALYSGIWEHHWIYWAAPIMGAQIAALAYRFLPGLGPVLCCKLYHTDRYHCHHAACRHSRQAQNRHAIKPPKVMVR